MKELTEEQKIRRRNYNREYHKKYFQTPKGLAYLKE